jgi:hypothetical protein
MNLGQGIVIGLCVILALWFAGGYIYNWRKTNTLSQALKTALEQQGKLSAYRRLGVSGAQFILENAKAPFRQIELVFLLEPRENLPLWLLRRIQGRQDELLFKANLRTAPAQEFQIGLDGDQKFEQSILSEDKKSYELLPSSGRLKMAVRGHADEAASARWQGFLDRFGKDLLRLSLQHKEPHLNVKARLSALRSATFEEFIMAVQKVIWQEEK